MFDEFFHVRVPVHELEMLKLVLNPEHITVLPRAIGVVGIEFIVTLAEVLSVSQVINGLEPTNTKALAT